MKRQRSAMLTLTEHICWLRDHYLVCRPNTVVVVNRGNLRTAELISEDKLDLQRLVCGARREWSSTKHVISINCPAVNWSGGTINHASIRDSSMPGAIMTSMQLTDVLFVKCNLTGANFRRSQGMTEFKESVLDGVRFMSTCCCDRIIDCSARGADFSHANLIRCKFYRTDLRGANFTRANLRDADLTAAVVDETTCFTDAIYNTTTQWPAGFAPPKRQRQRNLPVISSNEASNAKDT